MDHEGGGGEGVAAGGDCRGVRDHEAAGALDREVGVVEFEAACRMQQRFTRDRLRWLEGERRINHILAQARRPIDLVQHDCGVWYTPGEAHICADVVVRNGRLVVAREGDEEEIEC